MACLFRHTCSHILYMHGPPTGLSGLRPTSLQCFCFPCDTSAASVSLPTACHLSTAEIIPLKLLTHCQGQRCTQTRHPDRKGLILLFTYSSQLLTQSAYFSVTQISVAYYWKHRVTVTKLSALQREVSKTGQSMTSLGMWFDCEIADMKAQASHISFTFILPKFLLSVKANSSDVVLWLSKCLFKNSRELSIIYN